MHALWSWLLGPLGRPWLVAGAGWVTTLYLWQRVRGVIEIVVRDGSHERLIEVHPPCHGKVELYYESAQTGRVRLNAAAEMQHEALQSLACSEERAPAPPSPQATAPVSPKATAPVSPKAMAPVSPKAMAPVSPQAMASQQRPADDASPIPLPPTWPRHTARAYDKGATPSYSAARVPGDGESGPAGGLILHVGSAADLAVEHAARIPRRPTPVALARRRGLWGQVLCGAAGITLTAFAALWLLLPNRTLIDLLWFGVPLGGSAIVAWVVTRAVRR